MQIKELYLDGCQLQFPSLFLALGDSNFSLQLLSASHCSIGDECADYLKLMIENNKLIKRLYLNSNSLTDFAGNKIRLGLQKNSTL